MALCAVTALRQWQQYGLVACLNVSQSTLARCSIVTKKRAYISAEKKSINIAKKTVANNGVNDSVWHGVCTADLPLGRCSRQPTLLRHAVILQLGRDIGIEINSRRTRMTEDEHEMDGLEA